MSAPKRIVIPCAGLATDPNPVTAGPQGGMRKASNVVIEANGVASLRPGFGTDLRKETTFRPRSMTIYGGEMIVHSYDAVTGAFRVENDDGVNATGVDDPGLTPLVVPEDGLHFAESRRNLYWASSGGPQKITGSTAAMQPAGIHEATSGLASVSTIGTPVAIPPNSTRAWRWCFVRRDANGVETRSAPSPWCSFTNTNDTDTIDMIWIIPLVTNTVAGDQIELYAGFHVPETSTPSDMMYLSARYTVTTTDVANGYAEVLDARADADLGAELYTNPTREGLLKANGRPPASRALARWSNCMWYGQIVGPWTTAIEAVATSGNTTTPGRPGLQRFQTTYGGVAGNTITGIADTTSVEPGQLVTDNGFPGGSGGRIPIGTTVVSKTVSTVTLSDTPSGTGAVYFHDGITIGDETYWANSFASSGPSAFPFFGTYLDDPERTMRDLAFAISMNSTRFYAFAVEDPYAQLNTYGNPTKGTIVIRSRDLSDEQWAVSFTRPSAVSYLLDSNGNPLVERQDLPNAVAYSKPDEPEHVPELNFIRIGSESAAILALVPLRGALMVFKEDGIYRITGSAPDGWNVDLVDSSARLLRSKCVDVLDGAAYAWTDRGVLRVDETGTVNISDGRISRQLLDVALYTELAPHAFVQSWRAASLVLFYIGADEDSVFSPGLFVYSTTSGGWSTWDLKLACAAEDRRFQGLYIATRNEWHVRANRTALSPAGVTGFDAQYAISSWGYTLGTTSITVSPLDINGWRPKVGDWISVQDSEVIGIPQTHYRRVTDVVNSGIINLTIDSPLPAGADANKRAYEAVPVALQWQTQVGSDPFETSQVREMQLAVDFSASPVAAPSAHFQIGAATESVVTPSLVTVIVHRTANETPTRHLRIGMPREVSRASHYYPTVEASTFRLPWRCAGIALVLNPVSERTTR